MVVTLLGASNVELRCSYPRDAIWGPIPKDLIAKLGTKSGTLSFSTRRLQTRGSDNWTIYVVATSVIREQPFTLTP